MTTSRITLVADQEIARYDVLLSDGTLHSTHERFHTALRVCRELGDPNPTVRRIPRRKPRDLARFGLRL